MKNKMYDVLPYVKVAAEIFVLASTITTVAFISMFIVPYGPRPLPGQTTEIHITSMDIRNWLFCSLTPLILAFLTYVKIAKPLKKGEMPSKPWNIMLIILGYIFGLVIAGILLSIAYHKITTHSLK